MRDMANRITLKRAVTADIAKDRRSKCNIEISRITARRSAEGPIWVKQLQGYHPKNLTVTQESSKNYNKI